MLNVNDDEEYFDEEEDDEIDEQKQEELDNLIYAQIEEQNRKDKATRNKLKQMLLGKKVDNDVFNLLKGKKFSPQKTEIIIHGIKKGLDVRTYARNDLHWTKVKDEYIRQCKIKDVKPILY